MQVSDGRMCAIRLSADLKSAAGEKNELFRASSAGWVNAIDGDQYTTDGPFLYRAGDGQLLMLWSSFHRGIYSMGIARSSSGNILGPWSHDEQPLYSDDGGHGMIFRTFQGRALLAFHAPGMTAGHERAVLYPLEDGQGVITVGSRPHGFLDNAGFQPLSEPKRHADKTIYAGPHRNLLRI
jgi:hypothetical protein